MFFVYLSC